MTVEKQKAKDRRTTEQKRLDSARLLLGHDPSEIELVHAEVMQMMAHAAMSGEWSAKHAAKRWPDFAPTTALGKQIHQIVIEAVANAKAARETK